MSNHSIKSTESVSRRQYLRTAGLVSGGLALGSFATGSVSAKPAHVSNSVEVQPAQGQGGVGFISRHSFEYFEEETFYITKKVDGLTLTVPPACNGNAPRQTYQGYKIFFKEDSRDDIDIDCDVSDNNCSWIFINPSRPVKTVEDGFMIPQRIVQGHFSNETKNGPKPICRPDAPVSGDMRSEPSKVTELDVVRVTFAPAQNDS